MRHVIPRDADVAASLRALARQSGARTCALAKNAAAATGGEGSADLRRHGRRATKCHKPAVEYWKKTVHAQAWKTLVDVDKQYHYGCIGCHVTGWEQAGRIATSRTVEKRALVDVQCEVCHGPGRKHVEEAGLDEPRTIARKPPDSFCADNCHTKEHSDTFSLVPYLRDILGKGHGEKARAALGERTDGSMR